MKLLIAFVLGAIVGAYSLRVYDRRSEVPPETSNPPVGDTARDAAVGMKDAVAEKLASWHLTGDDIKADLASSGQVVRSKAQVAGDRIVDARIVTVIKAKFVLDRNLSARDISVESRDGVVKLGGTVPSPALLGHAVMLALDTDGVVRVVSEIGLKP